MWANILKDNDYKVSFYKVVGYGNVVVIPTLALPLYNIYLKEKCLDSLKILL